MRVSGFREVSVCGGANDMGADVIAYTPDGRRVVVQCKRYKGKLGSPDVQRFAGTARDVHRADVALLVTTGTPTRPAREVARHCRITLVDRPMLTEWAATQVAPIPSLGAPATTRPPAPPASPGLLRQPSPTPSGGSPCPPPTYNEMLEADTSG
ncbi:restriction endonuclease [Polymorphospora sp. NPDC051019]|uniref:restriction endonuclease n=1 Tax=Polymorphospora sp. NPDC051019 TaxID=3155725 RepID=UPI0034341FF0